MLLHILRLPAAQLPEKERVQQTCLDTAILHNQPMQENKMYTYTIAPSSEFKKLSRFFHVQKCIVLATNMYFQVQCIVLTSVYNKYLYYCTVKKKKPHLRERSTIVSFRKHWPRRLCRSDSNTCRASLAPGYGYTTMLKQTKN